jgi:hypothetical protein
MESMIFQIPAVIVDVNIKSKNNIKLKIDSQENLSPEAISRVSQLVNQLGWLSFNVHQIEADDIIDLPPLKKTEPEEKSPSQRLRAVFFQMWKQNNEGFKDSDSYYKYMMERLIEHFKSKLD